MKKVVSLLLSITMLIGVLSVGFSSYASYDSIGTARKIGFDTTYSSTLSASNLQDWYKFSISSSGKVVLNATHYTSGGDGHYEIYTSSGDEIWYSYSEIEYKSSLGYAMGEVAVYLYAGTFYLKVYATSSYSYGNYNINLNYQNSNESFVETLNNNDNYIGTANSIQLNNKYFGQLGTDDDHDFYGFSLPTSATVTLSATHYNSGVDGRYEIYDSSGDEIWYSYSEIKYNNAWNFAKGSVNISLDSGTYYLKTYSSSSYGHGFYSFSLNLKVNVPKPTGLKCTARSTSAEKVTWNKVAGVTGYQVQISNNGGTSWANYYNTSSNSYTFKGLTAGGKYKFRVRAYKDVDGTRYYSGWSSTLCSCAKPANVTLKSVSSPKKTQIKTTWAKAGGTVSGYQIYYGKNASFSSLAAKKNVSGKSSTSYTGKNFTKGRTYYVKVRTYTVFNGVTYYGAWSATKKVKSK